MATIKPIEARTIHQIQSGQVIVDLCSVVKELVENSLDAGATNIDVRFKNQGLDSIEVQDNGSGISKENYETLALKHYTSKLSTYADLNSLQTFGFRGEALSSLCALSKFTVTTCLASDAPRGSRLEFETSGTLKSSSIVPIQKGTTVTVERLFQNLPVRRRELERNIKREWNRVIGVLNQYACIQIGLKFSVSQQPTKGKRMILFSTKGNRTTRENIANVFGAKSLAVLIPLDLILAIEPTNVPGQRQNSQYDTKVHDVHVRGHVSRPAYGEGRQTPDRQMFFINGRPCGLPQFAKVFNEVYKSYNASQSPFIFADIQLDTHLYDVNVSPDKRTILLHDQTRMLDHLRESLVALFESQDYALPTSQLSALKSGPFKKMSMCRQEPPISETNTEAAVDSIVTGGTRRAEQEIEDKQVRALTTRESHVSTRSHACETQGSNLISKWIERKSNLRADDAAKDHDTTDHSSDENLEPAEKLIAAFSAESTETCQVQEAAHANEASLSLPLENAKETGLGAELIACSEDVADLEKGEVRDGHVSEMRYESDPPIPAVFTPWRLPAANANRTTPLVSLKRAAPEVATITIGDHTVTSVIGSTSKRQKVEKDVSHESTTQRHAKESKSLPSFNGRLTQLFAANTQSQATDTGPIEVVTVQGDVSDHSDSFSEQLFVEDDDGISHIEDGIDDENVREEDSNSPCPPPSDHVPESSPREPEPSPSRSPLQSGESELFAEEDHDLPGGVPQNAAKVSGDVVSVSDETEKRTQSFVTGGLKKKDATYQLQQTLRMNDIEIQKATTMQREQIFGGSGRVGSRLVADKLDAEDAEEKLSLTISKSDFEKMKIVGQFNLGFIIAVRGAERSGDDPEDTHAVDAELFIIDQHATDEKYNFERLQANTVVQSQRLVQPKSLDLTALEEEVIRENLDSLETNGFIVNIDESGDQPVGSRCQLLSLPLSRETTFSLTDLEELISLLTDHQSASASAVPRPSKVRKMFAMRACRSSVMIGKALTNKQMEKLVRHMGELDKPWNCPHGRPTMRHLCGLGAWNEMGWKEGDGFGGERAKQTDWPAYLRGKEEEEEE